MAIDALRLRAARFWRALWPVLVVAGGAVTCDSPSGLTGRTVALSLQPVLSVNAIGQFAGLTVDQVRLTAVRPPAETLATHTIAFPADSQSIAADVPVLVNGPEQLTVYIELLGGGTVMFSGSVQVQVDPGVSSTQTTPVPVTYSGPGSNITSITVAPGDSGAAYNASVPFRVTARDAQNNPVTSFYVGWSASSTAHRINANGVLTTTSGREVVWVRAHTPTGIWDSTRLTVAPVPSAVTVFSGNGQSGTPGAALTLPLVAKVIAQDNGPVVGARVTFAASTGGGSVNPTSALTDMNGLAQTTATLGSTGSNSYTASVTGLSSVSFSANASIPIPTLVFDVQPSNATAGQTITPQIQVSARDASNNVAQSFIGAITLGIASNPGSGTLAGTTTVSATAGVALFPGLSINKSGTGYTLSASATGLTSGTSSAFNIAPGTATTLSLVSGGSQSAAAGSQLAQPVVVKVADALGNGVPGVTVGFSVTTGSVGTASTTTNATGQASTTWTLGAAAGTQTLTATSTGLTGSPLSVTAGSTNIAGTTVSPHLDTVTAINGTRTIVAQARDPGGNPVGGGVFTWVSRNTAIATVNTSGVVTAKANGSTYIVATEAGGTRDSAQIVVFQKIASINITPSTRNIYLTQNFTFAATAVDGLGTPIPSQPTFTWSSTASAVATVDQAGKVTGVGLGPVQIRATSGTIIGTANVQIITPITRIAVVVDTVNASKTDTFTLTSLGLTRTYRAIAHDTLDAVMPGVTFTWRSTNGSVAVLDQVASFTARATSAANGVTNIEATAQGFASAPGALLTVSQVLASIELSAPATGATIAAGGGTVSLIARGKDANARYIPGGTFSYFTDDASIATVDAVTGLVTGVANGTAHITAKNQASTITSNALTVTVGGAVPSIISFGRDTLSVGRGQTTSIPVLLSKPASSALTVNLTSVAYAHWQSASIVIPQGAAAGNATLVGDSAGTTTLTATDGSGLGYAAASATGKVTANMSLTSSSYSINTTDIVTTQVRLSDPSPAGGTFVSFNYGTAGIAQVSPDPAFIPAGQLAADIQIRAVSSGTTTITPSAIGVNGAPANFQALAPVLTPNTTFIRLGVGQYEPNVYVYTPTYTNLPVPVTFTSSDTNIITVTPTATIPAGSYYQYFSISAKTTGQATVTFTAPGGWTASAPITVRSTTPYLGACCTNSLFTTSPQTSVTIYAEDSTRNAHSRNNSLLVHLRSKDTTIIRVIDTVVTIGPGAYYTTARIQPNGGVGSTYVIVEASGHQSDSTQYNVQGPPLQLSWSSTRVGAGQQESNQYVSVPNTVSQPLTVTLSSSDSNVAALPTTVVIPANSYYAYFDVRGKVPGSVVITATAPGYANVTANYIVTSPRVTMSGGTTLNAFSPARAYYVYATDSLGNGHARTDSLHVSTSSTNTAVITTDTSAVIPAGQYYTTTPPQLVPVGTGSAQIVAAAAGHRPDTNNWSVITPKLNFSFFSYLIGRRQHQGTADFYITTPDYRTSDLAVTLTQLHPAVDSLTATSVTVPNGLYYGYFNFFGLANGADTIIASAPGYLPDTAYVRVSTPQLYACCMPGQLTTTNPPFGLTVYVADTTNTAHYASDTVVVHALTSDSAVIRPVQEYFPVLKDQYYTSMQVSVVGPGDATITFSDSAGTGYLPVTTGSVHVTGPSLALSNGTPMIGMRQSDHAGSSYVYVPNPVSSPLVVNLVSTDPRVVGVPASVTIPLNSYYAYFEVKGLDTVGTIQVQATATGYNPANMNVQVTQPRFTFSTATQLNTTAQPYPLTVYATDANGNAHYVTEDVTVSLLSSAPSVAILDSTTITIKNGEYYHNLSKWAPGIVGTAQIQASDQRAAQYKYNNGTVNVSVVTPNLNLSWSTITLGIGQYDDHYVYRPDYPGPVLDVAIAHAAVPRVSTEVGGVDVASVQIPGNTYYTYFRIVGQTVGSDTLTFSATSPAHNPIKGYVNVAQGTLNPLGGWPSSLAVGDSTLVTLYARDINGGTHYVRNATAFTLAPNANIEFRAGGTAAQSVVMTQATIPADAYYIQFYVKALSSGTGSVNITATNYAAYSNTVSIP